MSKVCVIDKCGRAEDKVQYAIEILEQYAPHLLSQKVGQ